MKDSIEREKNNYRGARSVPWLMYLCRLDKEPSSSITCALLSLSGVSDPQYFGPYFSDFCRFNSDNGGMNEQWSTLGVPIGGRGWAYLEQNPSIAGRTIEQELENR